ncbi:MAG TPA: hypothetical protein VHR45_03550 [Thermoanaerobaculia bacterium]|nr:hypothetical protein [Thermoanaerobaculia bacterium]
MKILNIVLFFIVVIPVWLLDRVLWLLAKAVLIARIPLLALLMSFDQAKGESMKRAAERDAALKPPPPWR